MKIKKEYTCSTSKQIWRLLPSNTNKLIIEERDPELKEVSFSCIELSSGKKLFINKTIEEKFWIGIEKIYNDIIFLHKFKKPDMPGHIGIIAFDINKKEILWKNDELIFLFINNEDLFCYSETSFESKRYFKLNYLTGEILNNYGGNQSEIIKTQEMIKDEDEFAGYTFTQQFFLEIETDERVKNILTEERNSNLISGKINYIKINNLLLFSYHIIIPEKNEMKNIFKAVDIDKRKIIFDMELNRGVKNFIPDSFFIKDNLLFLLKEKSELIVCSLPE